MKFLSSICVVLALAGFAASQNNVPTFAWLQDSYSPDGIPHLAVDFHDGNPVDVVNLKKFNPFPRQAAEKKDNIDECIFTGRLRDDPDVYVTLTGGCPFDNSFDIMLRSDRTADFMFQVKEGSTHVVPSIFHSSKGLVYDQAIRPPPNPLLSFKNPPPTNALNLDVELNFDSAFKEKFGEDSYNAARRVATHSTNMFQWPSLSTQLTWTISEVFAIDQHWEANSEWLDYLGNNYNNAAVNTNVYLSYNYNEYGTVGLAWLGTICAGTNLRTATTEYLENDLVAAQIMSHEVGHNVGMSHDFNGSPGNPRYDSQGRTCTNIQSVMDYNQASYDKWSTCSNEDFNNNDHSCL
jgi:hypothetical protein